MLQRLRISNLVLIREASIELAPGLNAITGETGAGKTILTNAIGLLLGARGDAALIGAAPTRPTSRPSSPMPTTRLSGRLPSCGPKARTVSFWHGGSSPTAGRAPTSGGGAQRARMSPERPRR